MTPVKLKLNKLIALIIAALIVGGLIGYFLPHKPIVKEKLILCKVIEAIDGDTLRVKMNSQIEIVRLLGIDAPEVLSPYKEEECFGKEVHQNAKELLENQEIYLIPDSLSSDKGKYDRLLRYAFLSDGRFVNAELIKEGYAFNYIYEPFQFMKHFDYLEKQAKEKRLGLWGDKCDYYFEIENK